MASRVLLAGVVVVGLLLGGCGGKGHETPGAGGASPGAQQPQGPPPEVVVTTARKEILSPTKEWPAQTQAGDTVNVTARVEGTLLNFDFREGYRVSAGQVLFQIDPSEYLAQLQSAQAKVAQAQADLAYAKTQVDVLNAEASLASALASLRQAQLDVDRYTPLAKNEVIPQQTLDNAVTQRDVAASQVKAARATLHNTKLSDAANIQVAQANLEAARAAVTQAELNVGYCTITSPIDGTIGRLNVNPGNLVGQPGNTQPLATISRNDPMYVNFNISEADYLTISGSGGNGADQTESRATFTLLLADGKTYPYKGRFGLVERALDAKTGTLLVRTIFPNPKGLLREGQFARITATGAKAEQAVLIPQRSITTVQSLQTVYVVGEGDVVAAVNIETAGSRGTDTIVTSGLKGGERVIVEGIQKVKPGVVCKPQMETPAPGR